MALPVGSTTSIVTSPAPPSSPPQRKHRMSDKIALMPKVVCVSCQEAAEVVDVASCYHVYCDGCMDVIINEKSSCVACNHKIWGFVSFSRTELIDEMGKPKNVRVGLMFNALKNAAGVDDSQHPGDLPASSQTIDQLRDKMVNVMNAFNESANTDEVESLKRKLDEQAKENMHVKKRLRKLEASLMKPPPNPAQSNVNNLITKLSESAANNDLETLLHVQDGVVVHPMFAHAEYEKKLEALSNNMEEQFKTMSKEFFDLNTCIVRLEDMASELECEDYTIPNAIYDLEDRLEETEQRLATSIGQSERQIIRLQGSDAKVKRCVKRCVKRVLNRLNTVMSHSETMEGRVTKLEDQLAEHKKLLKDMVGALVLLGETKT